MRSDSVKPDSKLSDGSSEERFAPMLKGADPAVVNPAKAGIQLFQRVLDSGSSPAFAGVRQE